MEKLEINVKDGSVFEILSNFAKEKVLEVFQICNMTLKQKKLFVEENEDENHRYYDHAVSLAEDISGDKLWYNERKREGSAHTSGGARRPGDVCSARTETKCSFGSS